MSDEVWNRDEVKSPCVKICMLHPENGQCIGCYRTGDEIARWSGMDNAEREAVLAERPVRESLHKQRRGGRLARHHRG